jgi:hypothetical protein
MLLQGAPLPRRSDGLTPRPAFRAVPLEDSPPGRIDFPRKAPSMLRTDQRVVRLGDRRQCPALHTLVTMLQLFSGTQHVPFQIECDGEACPRILTPCTTDRCGNVAPWIESTCIGRRLRLAGAPVTLHLGPWPKNLRDPTGGADFLSQLFSRSRPSLRRPESNSGWC